MISAFSMMSSVLRSEVMNWKWLDHSLKFKAKSAVAAEINCMSMAELLKRFDMRYETH